MNTRSQTRRSVLACLAGLLFAQQSTAAGHGNAYDITITNLTRGESFTPVLVASHRPQPSLLFDPGTPASDALAALAEGGDTVPLNTMLVADPAVDSTTTSTGLLVPGASVTIRITARSAHEHVSLAAMLIPTNDGFFAFQDLALPQGHARVEAYGPAYDAGSEPNDELCSSIPGPVCGGEGGSPGAGGEGYVQVHSGIHGIGDLAPSGYDWRNPVVRVVITRSR